jgi:hypothetical protein
MGSRLTTSSLSRLAPQRGRRLQPSDPAPDHEDHLAPPGGPGSGRIDGWGHDVFPHEVWEEGAAISAIGAVTPPCGICAASSRARRCSSCWEQSEEVLPPTQAVAVAGRHGVARTGGERASKTVSDS